MQTEKRDSPSYHRNIKPITEVFLRLFPKQASRILEVGSGSGQHSTSLSKHFPEHHFYPTELNPEDLPGIDAWAAELGCRNIADAQALDVAKPEWQLKPANGYDILFCLNVIHITPWEITERLFEGAAVVINKGGKVYLYGPFKIDGEHTSPSNAEFEEWLKAKDARFGVRNIQDVSRAAETSGFQLVGKHEMPANNFIMEFALI